MSLPTTIRAVKVDGDKATIKSSIPLPRLENGYLLLKTKAVAGNPTDWKHIEYKLGTDQATLGCDVVGEIVKFGPDVDQTKFHIGDIVYGFIHGASARSPDNGAFAEYVALDSKLALQTPKGMTFSGKEHIPEGPVTTFEGAATIPCSWYTAGATLFHHFKLKYDWSEDKPQYNFPLLIWGGATALGQPMIQLAKKFHAYSKIIAVASKKHEAQLKAYGADAVFDYHDSDVIEQIKAKYNNIRHLYDCVSNSETIQQVYQCSSDKEDTIVFNFTGMNENTIKPELRRSNIKVQDTIIYAALGYDIPFGGSLIPADQEYRNSVVKFVSIANKLFLNGELRHIPVKVYKNGLEGTLQITDDIKNGRNSGEKLVAIFD
ncbi:hypothetical protein KAFR_0J02230 [Kazachstania africana CBS 2517]|uniref:Enoyl reductase (ER) domain-containing protein n=1 Tax=Kazachstania africana (strain ATCC 22294 / BCRC 22015 / CBS 2517 / CECT 1963 / NBRC 1671 / NRRL Y-8276) TaxID=1071382 RepID=H2B0Y7_KAZAF|nr:hypothetical protein KAFR_0J02230 [Kazachstania africana CBS 2517]CCF60287.1 hypothetical protein KAFR_0J02230 [Kazachstania africana CBS 2517]